MILDPAKPQAELGAIPSVNAMGNAGQTSETGEARLTGHLEELLRRLGLLVQRQAIGPGQDNLLARLEGYPPPECRGRLVLLDAHQDTVSAAGMRIPPFEPAVRDGRLYGRGSCDVKGGMAAMLSAISRLAEDPPAERPTVILACTVNEENGFSGVAGLVKLLSAGPQGIFPRLPDAAVVAEPTGLDVVVAHKGVVRWRCHARGKAAHSSRPQSGENAIFKMAHALQAMQRYQNDVLPRRPRHPLCGGPTFSAGIIRGGSSVNIVPDHCEVELELRVAPGESLDAARKALVDYLASDAAPGSTLEHETPYMSGPALSDQANGPLADQLVRAAREVTGRCEKIGVPYATEAAFYAAAGVPAVVFGPGHIEQAHTDSEWISLDELRHAAEVYYQLLRTRPE